MTTAHGSCIWLATPEAAALFDPARQTSADADRWAKLNAPARRAEWAGSRALLAYLAEIRLSHASLSHSRGWSAALVAPAGTRAGVDLEWLRPRNVLALADYAFSAGEAAALRSMAAADRLLRFYMLWTLKEAFAKALGLALLPALRNCDFDGTSGRWTGYVPVAPPWHAAVYSPRPGLVLAAAFVGEAARNDPATKEWPGPQADDWPLLARVAPA
jgi:4'-phosphopantetheinyl transferase